MPAQVLLGFDGWDDTYDYWVGIDDGDFQPPGKCFLVFLPVIKTRARAWLVRKPTTHVFHEAYCQVNEMISTGTAMRAQARLSPPNGYRGFFDWASYLEVPSPVLDLCFITCGLTP
jgi:hypothetical protein